MPIVDTDIKLMASERMHDEEDGGGRMSGNEIVAGESNNMFPDVSQLDRTYGRLNLRKTYEAVLSDNTETFFGSNIIISKPPSDDTIHCTLFKTTSNDSAWVDERDDASNKIESYITVGQVSSMILLGTHYEGQRALLAYQRQTSKPPVAGEVLALVDDTNEQFVRITSVDVVEEIYTDVDGDYPRNEVTIGISDPLIYQFEGGTTHRETDYQPDTTLNKTNAIPAVSYYGIQPLAVEGVFDEREIQVVDYKGHLLPATQAEEALLDVVLSNTSSFENTSGTGRDVEVAQVKETTCTYVTVGNRGYTYVKQLLPKPHPGTVLISYRAQEKWYTVADINADGQLQGDGSGSVNYTTGSVSITFADMPDVDTRIIFGWGSSTELERRDTDPNPDPPTYQYTVVNPPILPGSVTITWDSAAKSVTDDSATDLTGDGTGKVNYQSGEITLTPTALMAPGEIPQVSYTEKVVITETFNNILPDSGTGLATVTLADVPLAYSVRAIYTAKIDYSTNFIGFIFEDIDGLSNAWKQSDTAHFIANDNGSGALGVGSGVCDYAAKTVTIDAIISYLSSYQYFYYGSA